MNPTSSPPSADRELVDRITYLASLASSGPDIDPMLDDLRGVTATWQPGAALDAHDLERLTQLENNLKDYLINHDPLRSFTPETLAQRLKDHAANPNGGLDVNARAFAVIMSVAVLAAMLVSVLGLAQIKYLILAVPTFLLAVSAGTGWFYLSALRNFKPELRRVFILICAGVALFSINAIQFVAIELFNLDKYPLFQYGGITAMVGLCLVFIYFGFRSYTGLLGIKTRFASLPLALAVFAVLSLVVIVVPHASTPQNERFFDASLVGLVLLVQAAFWLSRLTKSILRAVTPAYAKSVRWLHYYALVVAIAAAAFMATLFLKGALNGAPLYIAGAICAIPPQVVLLYTGFMFKRETSR